MTLAILGLRASLAILVLLVTQQRRQEQQPREALRETRHAIDTFKLAADEGRIAG